MMIRSVEALGMVQRLLLAGRCQVVGRMPRSILNCLLLPDASKLVACIRFDSKKEATYYEQLKLRQRGREVHF